MLRARAPGAIAPHCVRVLAYRASLLRPLLHGANVMCNFAPLQCWSPNFPVGGPIFKKVSFRGRRKSRNIDQRNNGRYMIQLELNDRQAYLIAKSIGAFKGMLEEDMNGMTSSTERSEEGYPTPSFTGQGISFIQETIKDLDRTHLKNSSGLRS